MPLEIDIANVMMTIGGFIIVTLLGAIGYFLRVFSSSVTELKTVVQQLSVMVSVLEEKISTLKEYNDKVHTDQGNAIDKLYDKVEDVERDVAVLKSINNK